MSKHSGSLASAAGRAGILLLGCLAFAVASARAEEKRGGHRHWCFAESARAVADGHYVSNFQVATVCIDGQDTYLADYPNGSADPEWNRDGSRIYFEAIAFNDTYDALFWVPSEGGPATLVQTGCGDDPNCLGDDNPAISPDGRTLLINRAFLPINPDGNASNCSIFTMTIDGSGATQITFPGAGLEEDHVPRWSPDGRQVLFSRLSYETGTWAIYVANADGSNAHAITGLDAGDPDWSPDGRHIVFQSPAEPDFSTPQQIYKIHPDGTHLVQLTNYAPDPNLTIKTFRPRWSPDGKKIAFTHVDPTTTLGPDGIPHGDIFVMSANGNDLVQVTHTPEAENGAAWDPRPFLGHHDDDRD